MKLSYYNKIIASVLVISSLSGCKKLVDAEVPGNRIAAENVFSKDATAIAVLNGLYSKLSSYTYTGTANVSNLSMWAGLSTDELTLWIGSTSAVQIGYFKNSLSSAAATGGYEFWTNVFPYVYICNAAIAGLSSSTSLTPAVKNQLLGEAKFMRAFFYFYLVNLYGGVPLVLTTDYTINAVLTRSPENKVYDQIILDLKEAQELLADGFVKSDAMTLYTASAERVRPNKAAASALLSRVFLYIGKWSEAEIQSTSIINNSSAYDTVSLNMVFLRNSKETIWQLQPVTTSPANTQDAYALILTRAPVGLNSTHPVYLSSSLWSSFEPGDKRKLNGNWMNVYTDVSGTYYYPYKYKDVSTSSTEYTMMLRISEQYLIRAEARAQQNNIAGAQNDLNLIRERAGLSNTNASDQGALLAAILKERRVELFAEFGHRWLDLKRTGNVDAVMTIATAAKGGTWESYQQLYPISGSEISKNPNLVQNPGY